MTAEMPMPGQEGKKGMSKGCLVALIVVGVVIAMVIIAGIVCYMKKDELMKAGTKMMVNSVQQELMDNPVDGVDTVAVNRVADAFLEKLEQSDVDMESYGRFAQLLQGLMSDKQIDADEAEQLVQGMIDYFPELEDLATPETWDTGIEDSSTGEETDSLSDEW